MNTEIIRTDFDRLARLDTGDWSHNSQYHAFLLKQLPPSIEESLEIGCGAGSFTRLLAQRSKRVVALDLSSEMIAVARERSGEYSNIEYRVADVISWEFPVERFDCVASIATFHHLPVEVVVPKMVRSLKPGGVLLVLDLCKSNLFLGVLTATVAIPAQIVLRLVHTGQLRESHSVRQAWALHGKNDVYLPFETIQRNYQRLLPNARIRKRLLWRYSLVWKKPDEM